VRTDAFTALADVSFDVAPGEFFGIVGRNGSGKSTLLKCLAGIYRVDSGEMAVRGRISTFIELGVGFNADLAARDNIILNAIMLGLSPAEARDLVDPVLDFAELREFSELKLKNYSSGMHVRLAFSVMLQAKADIMMIDEVLAVGDASFQEKCFKEFIKMREEGRTVLFVTHDMGAVERFCDRAMLLERGKVVSIDKPGKVARRYVDLNFRPREEVLRRAALGLDPAPPNQPARFLFVHAEDPDTNEPLAIAASGETCRLRARLQALEDIDEPSLTLEIQDDQGNLISSLQASKAPGWPDRLEMGQIVDLTPEFKNALPPGNYVVNGKLAQGASGLNIVHQHDAVSHLKVVPAEYDANVIALDYDARVEFLPAEVAAPPAPAAEEPVESSPSV
jgi:ABC-type polysaccharide/polyol phosphate transport system ATPase subunit